MDCIPPKLSTSSAVPPDSSSLPEAGSVSTSKKEMQSWLKSAVEGAPANAPLASRKGSGPADQVPLTKEVVKALGVPPSVALDINAGGKMAGGSGFPIHPRLIVTDRHCIDDKEGKPSINPAQVRLPGGLWGDKSQLIRPIRYHLFAPDGSVVSIDLLDAEGKHLSPAVIDERLKGFKGSKHHAHYAEMPDIALIELEKPLDIDPALIPPLLDDSSIEDLLSDQASRRVVGFPSAKIRAENKEPGKKQSDEYYNILQEKLIHISEMGVSKPFKPHGSSKDALYWGQRRGILSYGGNSGGAVIASAKGKPYYAGILVAGSEFMQDSTILPLKGKVMTELVLPTLNAI